MSIMNLMLYLKKIKRVDSEVFLSIGLQSKCIKVNIEKSHLLLSGKIYIPGNKKTTGNKQQESFAIPINKMGRKGCLKLNSISQVASCMDLSKPKLIMRPF